MFQRMFKCGGLCFAMVLLIPLCFANAATPPPEWPCGDLNGDDMIHIGDAVDFIEYMADLSVPMPDSFQNADMDGNPGVTPGDLAYLLEFLYNGGPFPCSSEGQNDPVSAGSIELVSVQGLIDQNTVASGRQLKFTFQCSNGLEQGIMTMTNGFAVTSPDGVEPVAGLAFTGRVVDDSLFPYFAAPETADNLGFFLFDVQLWVGQVHVLDSMSSDMYFVITVDPISVDDTGKTIVIDSSAFGHLGYWEWYIDGLSPVIPSWGGPYTFTVGEPGYLAGDINDNGEVNVTDVTDLVAYMFLGGPTPPILEACDVNGDCEMVNMADLTYLVDYMFQGGNDPQMHCAMASKAAPATDRINVSSTFQNDRTTIAINSDIDLRGIELELTGDAVASNLLADGIELIQGDRDGTLRIGLLDMEGAEIIAAGEHRLVELSGRHDIVSAVVSDVNHRSHPAALVEGATGRPGEFRLSQNYPNPFNPSTSIDFEVPHAGRVRLDVFNVAGQKVATLVDGDREAGMHTVLFEAGQLSSGIYLYRLTAGENSFTRKMLLLK